MTESAAAPSARAADALGPPSPYRADLLAGQRILLTGGGTGLGRGVAEQLAAHGAHVQIWGRRESVLADAAEQITRGIADRPHPGVVTFRSVDVRDAEAVEAAVQRIWEEHGPLTGAINNAAGNFISPTEKLSPRGFAAITDTVMKGSYHVTHAVGRRWIEQGLPGTVLSTLVSWVHTGSAFVVPSAMAKSAVLAMTRSLAVEWARHGIRLNAVSPGAIPTEYTSVVLGSGRRVRGDMTDLDAVPAGRAGTVAELANLVIFLLSDACEYLTGQNIVMDGAQMLAGPSTFSPLTALSEADWAEIAAQGKAAAAASRCQREG
ncbi:MULTISPECIES: SDR family oxidoreductase [Rothia]|uniref:SDR family oxidoreductase n=1 Tax=Rothia TaxID=32207 RepID=UPI000772F26B|nr:SDR family oxidoreductase [Rothia kristinae]MCT1357784.1 SDR family oxidoreductase [Rothia kristinae]MCT1393459.1 SDR family oxidoreductase [Rothia kristinae]MCT1505636.1 SDR family oxidoreductase [Rothia kristinae]MCT2038985.1 SDR family oxidoreductase [Rothia kristinae]MCT2242852.1 SDR family oxidoreductase [Rothia kristinae]